MKYAPRKVFILENGKYIELTYQQFEERNEKEPEFGSKWFIPVQGCLLETDQEQYADFYREKERQKYLYKLDENVGLLSIDAFDTETDNGIDYIADTSEDVAVQVERKMMIEKLHHVLPLLSEDERNLIIALFFERYTEREYATAIGISQVAVHKRKHRILEKLKKILEN